VVLGLDNDFGVGEELGLARVDFSGLSPIIVTLAPSVPWVEFEKGSRYRGWLTKAFLVSLNSGGNFQFPKSPYFDRFVRRSVEILASR